ncbi:MAG: ABC transporter ATP-binding protein [Pseudomonadota bacterium]
MRSTLQKLIQLTNPASRKKVVLLIGLMMVSAMMQSLGIASVMPFLAVVGEPDVIHSNGVLQFAYEYFEFQSDDSFLFFLGLVAFVMFVVGTALTILTQWSVTMFGARQQYHLSRRLMEDYLLRPYEFYLKRNSSDLAKVVLQETGLAVTGALTPAMRLMSHALVATSIIAFLIFVSPILAVSVASLLGTSYALIFFLSKRWLTTVGKERVRAQRERFVSASEAFVGQKEIRVLGRERSYLGRFERPSRRLAGIAGYAGVLQELPQNVIEAFAFGGILLLVLVMMGEGSSLAGVLPILGAYGLAGKKLIPAFQKIFATFANVRLNMATVDSVLSDMRKLETSQSSRLTGLEADRIPFEKSITFRGIQYAYPDTEKLALDGVSMEIPANSSIGVVGKSGSGKSTLIDVFLGLLQPAAGSLTADSTEINSRNLREWQATIGYVPQHIFLSDQSLAENIALGVPKTKIDFAAVERAATLANLHEFVLNDLPEAYETQIGERGVRLSGGQRQRIGIARALYRDPPILLFDEATSALDNETERAVMASIENLSGKKTIVMVAHRLTTVQHCDQIFLMSDGRILERGTWDELNREGSQFALMANG